MNRRIIVGAIVLVLLSGAHSAWAGDRLRTVGDVLDVTLPIAAAVTTIGQHDGDGARQLALAVAATWGVTYMLKHVVDERRPNGGEFSFPSGHASSSFASAEFLRRRYGWKWGAPAYAFAALVGYSRVVSKMHYTHDVIAGAAIGVASGLLFVHRHRRSTVAVSGDAHGIQFTFTRVW